MTRSFDQQPSVSQSQCYRIAIAQTQLAHKRIWKNDHHVTFMTNNTCFDNHM